MNTATWLQRAGATFGELPAIAFGDAIARNYHDLARRTAGLAAGLQRKCRLKTGERVAIVASNHPAYLETLFATWWSGLIAVPIDARLHPSEVGWILEDAGARALFLSPDLETTIGALDQPGLDHVVTLASEAYEHLLDGQPVKIHPRDPDDGAWLFYTSGTTGRPKGALLSHRNIAVMAIAHLADVDPTEPGDVMIHSAPLSHASGLLSIAQVCRVGLNVIPGARSFDPAETIALIHRWRRASLFAAPTMLRRLVDAPGEIDRTAIRTIIWGGAPMHVTDVLRALDRLGPCLAQVYGQGETPMTITSLSKQAIAQRDHPAWSERLESAGTPRSVVEVVVAGGDDRPLPAGELGEVLVRGDTVMRGYWNNPEATKVALRGGWLHTGDIGMMDGTGTLTLRDRSKDLIISGGLNIYPREVEEILAAIDGVREVSVIGRSDPEWGEIVVAYISGNADPADLDRACLERIARFKRPRAYMRLDALPKNNAGKILKTKLRELDARHATADPTRAVDATSPT